MTMSPQPGGEVRIRGKRWRIVRFDAMRDNFTLHEMFSSGGPLMILDIDRSGLEYEIQKEMARKANPFNNQPIYTAPSASSQNNFYQPLSGSGIGSVLTVQLLDDALRSLQEDNELPDQSIDYDGPPYNYDDMARQKLQLGDVLKATSGPRKWEVTKVDGDKYMIKLMPNGTPKDYSHARYEEAVKQGVLTVIRNKNPKVAFDPKQLDKVVLSADAREDIIAVMSQASKRDLIFNTWGLGETIEYGQGIGMLFYGGPGTGKTWAAHCIAKSLGQELMVVTTGQIQSSLAGQTNKNIENAFKAARENNHILFMDECDSFISDRKHLGMILSSEINTILTCIEKSEGITILATNKIDSLDPALERRLALIMEFPKPTKAQRVTIWETLIPKTMPLGKGVDAHTLAEHMLTGGMIKNVLLSAARLAASSDSKEVSSEHFDKAIARIRKSEGKMGKRDNQMGVVDYVINGSN